MHVRSPLFASVVSAFPRAFVNTNSGSKFFVCATPKETDLTLTQYAALVWVEVGGVGNLGETGTATNVLTYNTWGTKVSQKGKGIANAGDPALEVARNPADPGQSIMRDGANTNFNYAFKLQRNDPVPGGTIGTIIYNRGIIAGPRRPNGRVEDFDLEMYNLGFNQVEIVVPPVAANP